MFEAGRQYTFLLTLGLDGEEIVFSIPTVTAFNESAVVDAPQIPWKCGDLIKTYTTANYNNTGIEDLCWTTQNIAEGIPTTTSYDPGATSPQSGRGWYYELSLAEPACQQLGPDWHLPDLSQWQNLVSQFSVGLNSGVGTSGSTTTLRNHWIAIDGLAGWYDYQPPARWSDWGTHVAWADASRLQRFQPPASTFPPFTFHLRLSTWERSCNSFISYLQRILEQQDALLCYPKPFTNSATVSR
ncbi:hypothetical protein AGMMS49525_14320 [Bacteroidia bacterium]|nr:hypothetical protein AGMMS49525_14320 [Bacteroidia bacterium]